MSLLPESGGETSVLDAQDTAKSNHRGHPPPALVCRTARAGVLAESVLKRDPQGPGLFKMAKVLPFLKYP